MSGLNITIHGVTSKEGDKRTAVLGRVSEAHATVTSHAFLPNESDIIPGVIEIKNREGKSLGGIVYYVQNDGFDGNNGLQGIIGHRPYAGESVVKEVVGRGLRRNFGSDAFNLSQTFAIEVMAFSINAVYKDENLRREAKQLLAEALKDQARKEAEAAGVEGRIVVFGHIPNGEPLLEELAIRMGMHKEEDDRLKHGNYWVGVIEPKNTFS